MENFKLRVFGGSVPLLLRETLTFKFLYLFSFTLFGNYNAENFTFEREVKMIMDYASGQKRKTLQANVI